MLNEKKKTRITGTIAQILVCVLLFPFLAILIQVSDLDFAEMFVDFFVATINGISIMELWGEVLVKFSDIEGVISEIEQYSNDNLFKWASMMYQIWVIGFITELVHDPLKKKCVVCLYFR